MGREDEIGKGPQRSSVGIVPAVAGDEKFAAGSGYGGKRDEAHGRDAKLARRIETQQIERAQYRQFFLRKQGFQPAPVQRTTQDKKQDPGSERITSLLQILRRFRDEGAVNPVQLIDPQPRADRLLGETRIAQHARNPPEIFGRTEIQRNFAACVLIVHNPCLWQ